MAPKDKQAVDLTAETDSKKDASKKTKKKDDGSLIQPTDTLSDEDRELKERLETCVTTVAEQHDPTVTIPIRLKALDVIRTELRTATSSMPSVPKPLKFLRPHIAVLKQDHTQLS